MRFLSAPWVGMLQDGVWLRHAAHANQMADYLERSLRQLPEVKILFPRQANSVFVELPAPAIARMWQRGWMFYNFIGKGGCRLMCAWDTVENDVNEFVADLKILLSAVP
jgi:threonine aldolase